MRRSVLWDSSAILALLDADDADHEAAVTGAEQIATDRRPSFMTNYVEVEARLEVAARRSLSIITSVNTAGFR